MTIIKKHFETLSQAENFHQGLYEKFSSVLLVGWPLFSERGTYVFKVDKK